MKKFLGVISVLTLILITLGGCYYDNEQELYPSAVCDSSGTVTYNNQVVPIISNNCYNCHSNSNSAVSGGGYSFEGYTNISAFLASPGGSTIFLERINGTAGERMPKGGPYLSNCNLAILNKWVNTGYQQ